MIDPRLKSGLLQIYEDLVGDLNQLGPVCDLSGRCCRFKEYGHRLYLTRTEAELLLEEGLPAGSTVNENGCPFQQGLLCTAREKRPFGCRVFYCDPRYAGQAERLSEKYLAQLRLLHDQTNTPWEYGELFPYLHEFAESSIVATAAPSVDDIIEDAI